MKRLHAPLLLFLHLLLAPVAISANIYVDAGNTSGTEDGTLANPYNTIQEGVDAAADGDEIRVAQGTYNETVPLNQRQLTLKGGYNAGFTLNEPDVYVTNVQGIAGSAVFTLESCTNSQIEGFAISGGLQGIVIGEDPLQWPPITNNITITNNLIENNGSVGLNGTFGGGIGFSGNNVSITNNIIRNNIADRGAGIANNDDADNFLIQNNLVEDNNGQEDHGGGMYLTGNGDIINNIVQGNTTGDFVGYGWGGGIITLIGTVNSSGNIIRNNFAESRGGGFFVDEGGTAYLNNELIYGNSSNSDGAAIYVDQSYLGVQSNVQIISCTIVDNISNEGPWGAGGNGIFIENSTVDVSNCIFWNNANDEFYADATSTLNISYSLTDEAWAGAGNKTDNPKFVDAANNNYRLKSTGGHWNEPSSTWVTDAEDSPALDAGDPTSSYANEPMQNGGRINMGYYGNTTTASKAAFALPPTASFTYVPSSPVCSGTPVIFTNTSTYNINNSWDFGDGNTSTEENPEHTYSTSGSYTVTLTISNYLGSDSEQATFIVNTAPTANAGGGFSIVAGASVQLNASGGVGYEWLPMSGLSDPFIANPVATPYVTTNYSVRVTSTNGCTDTDQLTVNVSSPPNVNNVWKTRGIGGGGALYAPSISPHNEADIYMACDMGELFYSKLGGSVWEPTHFTRFIASPRSRVQFTSNPDVLYAISTDGDSAAFPVKSTDGGQTWSPINDPTSGGAYFLYADPNATNRVLLTDYSRLYFSNNGGTSFTQVFDSGGFTSDGLYMGGVFWNGNDIYVGCALGLLLSNDGGGTFNVQSVSGDLPANSGFLSFSGALEGGTLRLFAVARATLAMWPDMQASEYWNDQQIYRLDVGDPNGWQAINAGIDAASFPFWIAASPDETDVVYVAGSSQTSFPTVYKSTDGGLNWTAIFLAQNNENTYIGWHGVGGDRNWWYGECALGFTVAPGNPDMAMITDFGFAHITTDGGQTWHQLYVNTADENIPGDLSNTGQNYHSIGLENTSAWWLTWTSPNDMWACYTDIRGIRSEDSGDSWSFDYTGMGYNSSYYSLEHPNNGNLYLAVASIHDIYQSTYLSDARIDPGTGEVLYSTDGGETWQSLHDFEHPVLWLALDPNNTNRMYASVAHSADGDVYVTNNLNAGAASTWTRLASPPRTEGHPFNIHVLNDGTLLATYSGRRTGAGFTTSSGVFTSTDGGATWTDVSIPEMYRWTKDVVIDPHNPTQGTWYACVHSHWGAFPNEVGGIYKTTNRGVSWTLLVYSYRVESCTINPQNSDEMYFTTEFEGLWKTDNLTAANPTFELVEEYPFQHPTRVFYNPYDNDKVWVVSFGNGMRVYDAAAPPLLIKASMLLEGAYNGANMNTTLAAEGSIPNAQPYDQSPWDYTTGTESLAVIPNDMVDWVLLELYDLNFNLMARRAVVLRNDGVLTDLDGSESIAFAGMAAGNYRIIVRHRNHIDVLSATAVALPNAISYDFSIASNVSGGAVQLADVGGGKYALKAGDFDGNGVISVADYNIFKVQMSQMNGYFAADADLDGNVVVQDLNRHNANSSAIGVTEVRY